MTKLPLLFVAKASATPGIQVPWKATSAQHEINLAVPAEFEGSGDGLSPEDLFAQALVNCFVGTFKVFAEKSRLNYQRVQVSVELTVDADSSGKTLMKSARIVAEIAGAEKPERAKALAEKAFQSGFILNSVKTELSLSVLTVYDF